MRRPHIKSIKMRLVIFVFLMMMMSSILTGILVLFSLQWQLWIHEGDADRVRIPFQFITWTFLIISTVIGSCLSLGFSRHFLQPIYTLADAMNEIRKGNYHIRVKGGPAEGEVNHLIQNFNEMASELQGVEILKSDFINYFSHEFKTPIISIQGFAKQLRNEELEQEKRDEYREIIIRESERLVKLSTNTLILTKLESQKIVTEKTTFDLGEQLRHSILLLQKEWEDKALELDLELEDILIFNNEEMLSQVWINLLSNAIAYSHAGGALGVSCKKVGREVKVKIKDTGIGMSDTVSAKIFEKFYQGDASRSTQGNGLGLSIVKRIVDLCQGRIAVKSQLGKGSTFLIYLPLE